MATLAAYGVAGFCLRRGRAEIYRGRWPQDRTSHHAESCRLSLHSHPIINQRGARAHPKKSPGPSQTIGSHLQSSPTWCCTPSASRPRSRQPPRRARVTLVNIFHSLTPCRPCASVFADRGLGATSTRPQPPSTPQQPCRGREPGSDACLTRRPDVCASQSRSAAPSTPTQPCCRRRRLPDTRFSRRSSSTTHSRHHETGYPRHVPPRHAPYIGRDWTWFSLLGVYFGQRNTSTAPVHGVGASSACGAAPRRADACWRNQAAGRGSL